MMVKISSVKVQNAAATVPPSSDTYVVKLSTNPTNIEANKPFSLIVTVLNADGKTSVTAFDEVHTKLLHFILVSQDLTQFLHVHPDYQGNGVFILKDLILPVAANYVTYADFTPTGDQQHYVRNTITVTGATEKLPHLVASPSDVTVGSLKISLDGLDILKSGVETSLKFHVSDVAIGAGIDNLDEYLGAAGHLVIIDEANHIYIHTHPAGHDMKGMSGMADIATATPEMAGIVMPMHYGPDLEFMTDFPDVGLWAMWLQVQYKGDVYTFPFVVDVADNIEGTPEAHAHG